MKKTMTAILATALTAGFLAGCSQYSQYEKDKNDAISLMKKEYGGMFSFEHYMKQDDYDMGLTASDYFYVSSSNLEDVEIYVDTSAKTPRDNYLFYYYHDQIDEYFTDVLDDYFPGKTFEISYADYLWLHETKMTDFDTYMKDMEGTHLSIKIVYDGNVPDIDEFDKTANQIKADGLNYDWTIDVFDGDQIAYYSAVDMSTGGVNTKAMSYDEDAQGDAAET